MIIILNKNEDKISSKLVDYIKQLPDGKYRITIEKFAKNRSIRQNNLYWAYLRLIESETGQESNDLHEYFKRKLLPPRFVEIFGEEIKLPATTTKLNSKEFGEYLEKISIITGIPIPQEINI